MIDVHMLTLPNESKKFKQQCLDSLINEPITLHLCSGIYNNIALARSNAFLIGNLPYQSFVDPDDWVLSGGFTACLNVLESNSNIHVVYTHEFIADLVGNYHLTNVKKWCHHLIVFRRQILHLYLYAMQQWKWPNKQSECQWIVDQIKQDYGKQTVYEIKTPYYVWRQRFNSITHRRI